MDITPLRQSTGFVLVKNCNDLKDPLGEGADILIWCRPDIDAEALLLFNSSKDARQYARRNAPEYYPIEVNTAELSHLLDWFLEQGGRQVGIFRIGDDLVRFIDAKNARRHLDEFKRHLIRPQPRF
jgi:hypothetical protein